MANEDYELQRYLQGREQLRALAAQEGILPSGLNGYSATMSDPNDFTNKYNTKLSAKDEKLFQEWIKSTGRENDLYDYDMRGAWQDLMTGKIAPDARGHLPDTYKKPNHPTFSGESKYNGVDGYVGGTWSMSPDGRAVFVPGKGNMLSKGDLNNYFMKNEPNAILMDNREGETYNSDGVLMHSQPDSKSLMNLFKSIRNTLGEGDNEFGVKPLAGGIRG